jgi:hypothetical protein
VLPVERAATATLALPAGVDGLEDALPLLPTVGLPDAAARDALMLPVVADVMPLLVLALGLPTGKFSGFGGGNDGGGSGDSGNRAKDVYRLSGRLGFGAALLLMMPQWYANSHVTLHLSRMLVSQGVHLHGEDLRAQSVSKEPAAGRCSTGQLLNWQGSTMQTCRCKRITPANQVTLSGGSHKQ